VVVDVRAGTSSVTTSRRPVGPRPSRRSREDPARDQPRGQASVAARPTTRFPAISCRRGGHLKGTARSMARQLRRSPDEAFTVRRWGSRSASAGAVPRFVTETVGRRAGQVVAMVLDTSKSQTVLGWHPLPLDQALTSASNGTVGARSQEHDPASPSGRSRVPRARRRKAKPGGKGKQSKQEEEH
jgi:hypothetical protein